MSSILCSSRDASSLGNSRVHLHNFQRGFQVPPSQRRESHHRVRSRRHGPADVELIQDLLRLPGVNESLLWISLSAGLISTAVLPAAQMVQQLVLPRLRPTSQGHVARSRSARGWSAEGICARRETYSWGNAKQGRFSPDSKRATPSANASASFTFSRSEIPSTRRSRPPTRWRRPPESRTGRFADHGEHTHPVADGNPGIAVRTTDRIGLPETTAKHIAATDPRFRGRA